MIEVEHLTKCYGKHVAVDNLSFKVEKGQIYGFLGPNGAGKSTTMNIMTGFIGPTEGQVLIDGISVIDEPEKAKKKIGYLPEQPPLYADMTVLEYLDFVAGLKKISKKEKTENIEKVMGITKIDHVSQRLINNLSKGYKQRVGLAQALIGFPEIIILDEPTVGLDPKQIIEIRNLIKNLSQNHTVLLSSHILSEIQEICDYIMIIHNGKMAAEGTQPQMEAQFCSETNLLLTVKGSADRAGALFTALAGDSELTVSENDGETELIFNSIGTRDIREEIFRICAGNDLPILGMTQNKFSLEDIFLKLTQDDIGSTASEDSQDVDEEEEENHEGGI